jgi:hypothetical protein
MVKGLLVLRLEVQSAHLAPIFSTKISSTPSPGCVPSIEK